MKKIAIIIISLILLSSAVNFGTSKPTQNNASTSETDHSINNSIIDNAQEQQILQNINSLDGFFTENMGQVGTDFVRYYIQGKGVWFLDDCVVFEIKESVESESRESINTFDRFHPEFELEIPRPIKSVVLKLNFKDCNDVELKGIGSLSHRSNFFYGNDSTKWCTNVANYQELIYENIWDDIDLRYYSSPKGLKYDFIVHPGGDPNDIHLRYDGAEKLEIDSKDNLVIQTQLGNVFDSDIFIYQNLKNEPTTIDGRFKILNNATYGFELLKAYDKNFDLIIDPLLYSTYIGGIDYDVGHAIEVDTNGCAYITGDTHSSNFPNTTGAYNTTHNGDGDAFVIKLNHNGSGLIYSSFIGGIDFDSGDDLKIDNNGSVYVLGITFSIDFPTTSNAYDTGFNGNYDYYVLKLNLSGNGVLDLNYSTYFGGDGFDFATSLALDSNNNVYITGNTDSNTTFPITAGAYQTTQGGYADAFFVKINPASTGPNDLIYSTFIGGSTPAGFAMDIGLGIAVDSSGIAYITGETESLDFPTTANAYRTINFGFWDGFITKIDPAGGGITDLLYSTYFGGAFIDEGLSITLDSNNNVIVTGKTDSFNFPTTPNAYDTTFNSGGPSGSGGDIFIFKITPTAFATPSFSTFVGGSQDDYGNEITIDAYGEVYITGSTSWTPPPVTSDFPITNNSYDETFNGGSDAIVIKLNITSSKLLYSSFIGGGGSDGGAGIAIDSNLSIYITGSCDEPNFPNTTGTFDQKFNGGTYDCFVSKIEIDYMPEVLDLNISKPNIFRTDTVHLYSNSTDIDEPEQNLTPLFEYRDANDQVWNNTFFSTPKYNNSRWETSFTPPKNATLGLYDLRVRVNDTTSIFSEWYILNDVLMVKDNLPEILDLNLSCNTTIQHENVTLWIDSTDLEDNEVNLTAEIMYQDPTSTDWNKTYLTSFKFINDNWTINFSAPFEAPFGYYDFRARVIDSDGNYSTWLYLYDSLFIYNKGPEVFDMNLSKNTVYRTNTVYLYVDGSDHETSENKLKLYTQFKHSNENEWTNLTGSYSISKNNWKVEFVTKTESILGFYDFRARFEDNNISSTWAYKNDSIEVLNNLPEILETLDDINVGVWQQIDLSPYGIDIENDDKNLTWTVNETQTLSYIESISIVDPINNTLNIVPFENIVDIEDIELILTDKDGGATKKSDITIYIDSRITKFTPKVTLLSPIDKEVVTTLTPTLEWDLNHSGSESITFHVYLDENPEPTTELISGLDTTSFTLENELEEGKTYYWKVIPTEGICLSDPFSFIIDLDYMPFYKVNLSSEHDYIPLGRGQFVEVNLTIKNEGNIVDNYKIEYNSTELQSHISIEKTSAQLEPGFESKLKLEILIPYDLEPGNYFIWIIATSLADEFVKDEVSINVEIVTKKLIPEYNVSISVAPEYLEIEQGRSNNITLIIINEGNIFDDYFISFQSDTFTKTEIQSSIWGLGLENGHDMQIKMIINVPENFEPKEYSIKFIVSSNNTSNETTITIKVKEKPVITEGENDDAEDLTLLYAGIGILVIILIIILILLYLFMFKKKPLQEPDDLDRDQLFEE